MGKENPPKYPRVTQINSEKRPSILKGTELTIELDKGQVAIRDDKGNLLDFGKESMTRFYEGAKRKKVLSWAEGLDFTTFKVDSLILNYDYIFAIDTNTAKVINCDFYNAAGVAYYAEMNQINDYSGTIIGKPYLIVDWYFTNQTRKMELETWKVVVEHLQTIIPADKKVGIIVDSELGLLSLYNNQDEPIVDDWYLPGNYQLLYATADKSDDWCNKLIRICDKTATTRLNEMQNAPKLKSNPDGCSVLLGNISFLDEINN